MGNIDSIYELFTETQLFLITGTAWYTEGATEPIKPYKSIGFRHSSGPYHNSPISIAESSYGMIFNFENFETS